MAETSVLVLEADYVDPTYTVYGTYYDLTGAVLSTFEVDTTSYGPPLVSEYLTGYRDRRLVASRENIACFFAGNYIVSYIDGNVYAFDFGIIDPSATGKTIKVLENGFFGALVNDDGAYFYISEDGINWTLQNTDPLGDSIDGSIQDVYYSDAENRYYLVSTYSEMASGEVIRTEDFVIFEDSVFGETDANTAGEELFCIYGNTVFVNPTATDPLMAYSVNGGTASTTAIVGLPSNTYRYLVFWR